MRGERVRDALVALAAAALAFVPFARGALGGESLYFRDLSLHFLPLRRFALEGLRAGSLRFWNPYVHEGVPLSLPALGYPLDLLQLLRPDETGISLVLALHVPLAAAALFALARGLGIPRAAAAGGALVYALGGFLLSTVNLYVYAQAAAWAPLVVLALGRALERPGRRTVAAAALALAVALSTTGVEIVAQAVLAGIVLGATRRSAAALSARLAALALACALGLALAAPVLAAVAAQVGSSARGRGFATDVVLAHSVYPLSLLQVLIGNLHGNLLDLANQWWGQNFFPRGFPYVLSLYLGAAALALAATGLLVPDRLRGRLALLLLAGALVSLGRWAGLEALVDAAPLLRVVRYPVKAFFTAHLALALLVALGVAALERERAAWRTTVAIAALLGSALLAVGSLPTLLPDAAARFARGFFPPDLEARERAGFLAAVARDAAAGGTVALLLAGLGLLVLLRRLPATRGAQLAVTLVAADLLRTGAGLNPTVTPAFFQPSPELAARLPDLRQGRLFTCAVDSSPSYLEARRSHGRAHEVWSFGVLLETLTPSYNVAQRVRTACSADLTMLVPLERLLSPEEGSCRDLPAILPKLRRAGVRTVLSVDRLGHPELLPAGTLAPARVRPLQINTYRLDGAAPAAPRLTLLTEGGTAAPLPAAPGRLAAQVSSPRPARLVFDEAWAPGWSATVDGRARPVGTGDGHSIEIAVPAGRSSVELRYRPPLWSGALALSGGALAALTVLAFVRPRRR